jgi:hypothetical protein
VTEILAWPPGAETGNIAANLGQVAMPAGQDGAPARMLPAGKCPHQSPCQVQGEDIADPDVHGLQQDLAFGGHTQGLAVEYDQAHADQTQHAQQVDPVKPADTGIPYGPGPEFSHGSLPVVFVVALV